MKKPHNSLQQALTTAPLQVPAEAAPITPETFRMPKRGGDPYFGLTRGFYYNLEKRGLIRLIRIRDRGKIRGVVLIPYDQVKQLVMEGQG